MLNECSFFFRFLSEMHSFTFSTFIIVTVSVFDVNSSPPRPPLVHGATLEDSSRVQGGGDILLRGPSTQLPLTACV